MKHAYSIYEAKTHLSQIIQRVKKGSEAIISDRGTPVVRVIPYGEKDQTFEERLKLLTASGVLVPRKSRQFPKSVRRPGALKRFLQDRV